jgi:hypothetical protein
VHAVDEAHETAVKLLDVQPGAVGVASIDQAPPSKCSASVTAPVVRVSELPTAVQDAGETHTTAVSRTSHASAGFAGRWIDQRIPSQRSTNDKVGPKLQSTHPVWYVPTATHARLEGQFTLVSRAGFPASFGVGSIDQRAPSQRSANVRSPAKGLS